MEQKDSTDTFILFESGENSIYSYWNGDTQSSNIRSSDEFQTILNDLYTTTPSDEPTNSSEQAHNESVNSFIMTHATRICFLMPTEHVNHQHQNSNQGIKISHRHGRRSELYLHSTQVEISEDVEISLICAGFRRNGSSDWELENVPTKNICLKELFRLSLTKE
ncbi:hypothetical protein NPIL_624281 [Nephila pilipes]|uniref:Uncharacterized protein n=1 Tax=Nephila pilipes TaxID=299642 RepID=A0A8X6NMY7_NEPPI|nr:hypothetical protein NPIL_624281 [Nephila pilipes]